MNRRVVVLLLVGAVVAIVSANLERILKPLSELSQEADAPERPRDAVVLVVLDNVRADHLSLCGYERPTSDTLSGLAAAPNTTYTCRAYAPGSWTLPSHASYFTGEEVPDHGAMVRPKGSVSLPWGTAISPLGPELPTLAERMREKGYRTVLLSGNPVLSELSGLTRGFEEVVTAKSFGELAGPSYVVRLRELLTSGEEGGSRAEQDPRPVFLVMNIIDAHRPWTKVPEGLSWLPAQAPYDLALDHKGNPIARYVEGELASEDIEDERRRYVNAYDYGIFRADRTLKRSLDYLSKGGWLEGCTRLIVTSDHGEMLAEQHRVGHGGYLLEANNRVPILLQSACEVPPALMEPMSALAVFDLTLGGSLPAEPLPVRAVSAGGNFRADIFTPPLYAQDIAALWEEDRKWIWTEGEITYDPSLSDGEQPEPPPTGLRPPAGLQELAEGLKRTKEKGFDLDPALQEHLKAIGYVE